MRGDLLLASNESLMGPEGYERLAGLLAPQVLAAYPGARARAGATGHGDEALVAPPLLVAPPRLLAGASA